jgi:DNA-binding NarL/FixJ family response regulator
MTDHAEQLGVVIIDDSEEVRSALGLVIDAQSDLELLGAASGVSEGIDMVRRLFPDVVVLDVNMPDGGGQRAAREMTAAAPEVRIIAFSAFDKALIRKVMTAAGADAYISKSGNIRELLAAIRGPREPGVQELKPMAKSGVPWSED